jgi:hypothetical protein
VTPSHTGKTTAGAAETGVVLPFSAFSTRAAGNEHAIVQLGACLAHVRCSGPTVCYQRARRALVSAAVAAAVISARTALALAADEDG